MDVWLSLLLPVVILGFAAAVIRELANACRNGFNIKFLLVFTFWVAAELIFVLAWLKTIHPDR
jgi:hypothetical protein